MASLSSISRLLRRMSAVLRCDVVHQDPHIIVINKPSGVRTVPGNDVPERGEHYHRGNREVRRKMWSSVVLRAAGSLPQDQLHLQPYLEKLAAIDGVPRKRRTFLSFSARALRLRDAELEKAVLLWDIIDEQLLNDMGRSDSIQGRVQEVHPQAVTVHRLDMATSGVLVMALTAEAAKDLGTQFRDRALSKTYVAVVEGRVEGRSGEINLPIRPDITNRPMQIVDEVSGKPASTHWEVIDCEGIQPESTTRLRLRPKTGRTHQIRIHLARGLGNPIVGDDLYGFDATPEAPRPPRISREVSDIGSFENVEGEEEEHESTGAVDSSVSTTQRLLLHAERLQIIHPYTREEVEFFVPCPF